jgi:hypothetical protein
MKDSNFDRIRSKQKKWYIQPAENDSHSAQEIYKLLKNAQRIEWYTVLGCPTYNDFHLRETDRKTILRLLAEASIQALESSGTDFGLNFYVYVKEWNESRPRYRFATTDKMRKINGAHHKNRRSLDLIAPKLVFFQKFDTNLLPVFILHRENETGYSDEPKKKAKKVILKRFKPPSLYRISTHDERVIKVMIAAFEKAGKPAEAIPDLREGSENKEFVWNVSPSLVLELKGFAKNKNFVYFKIWKRNHRGQYSLVKIYNGVVKN